MSQVVVNSEAALAEFCKTQSAVAAHAQMALECALGVPDAAQEAVLVASAFSVILRVTAALEQHLDLVAHSMEWAVNEIIEQA